ncbi:MAG: hypothetical protein OCC45_11260 [Desulfotalea sp.]
METIKSTRAIKSNKAYMANTNLINKQKIGFSLPTSDGHIVSDTSFPGKTLLLVFHRHLA